MSKTPIVYPVTSDSNIPLKLYSSLGFPLEVVSKPMVDSDGEPHRIKDVLSSFSILDTETNSATKVSKPFQLSSYSKYLERKSKSRTLMTSICAESILQRVAYQSAVTLAATSSATGTPSVQYLNLNHKSFKQMDDIRRNRYRKLLSRRFLVIDGLSLYSSKMMLALYREIMHVCGSNVGTITTFSGCDPHTACSSHLFKDFDYSFFVKSPS